MIKAFSISAFGALAVGTLLIGTSTQASDLFELERCIAHPTKDPSLPPDAYGEILKTIDRKESKTPTMAYVVHAKGAAKPVVVLIDCGADGKTYDEVARFADDYTRTVIACEGKRSGVDPC